MVSPDLCHSPLPYSGLTSEQVKRHRHQFGSNVLTPPKHHPWWQLYLEKFTDPVIRILIIAAIIALISGVFQGAYLEALGIIIAIILATTLAFFNEYKASQEFELLNQVYDHISVKVIRAGKFTQILRQDLVVGDIVYLERGQEVPADGEILEEVSLYIDQSKITGEFIPVKKWTKTEVNAHSFPDSTYSVFKLYRSTMVMEGHGYFKVTAVGDHSEIGKLAQAVMAIEDGEPTPLKQQLDKLSKLIGFAGLIVSSLIFFSLFIRGILSEEFNLNAAQLYLVCLLILTVIIVLTPVWLPIFDDGLEALNVRGQMPQLTQKNSLEQWGICLGLASGIFILGISLSSAWGWGFKIIRYGFPEQISISLLNYFMIAVTIIVVAVPEGLAMSITLSLAYSMRKMAASNNLVRRMHACETIGAATIICTDKTGTLTQNKMEVKAAHFPGLTQSNHSSIEPYQQLIFEGISTNSTADLEVDDQGITHAIGNVTEGALLLWLDQQKIDYLDYRHNFKVVSNVVFSPDKKYMAIAGKSSVINPGNLAHFKGSPELILSKCSYQLTPQGIQPIESLEPILNEINHYQERGMRTLAFAYYPFNNEPVTLELETLDKNLIWLGFVAITDPLRPDVDLSLRACFNAGIKVKIVTGDSPKTAQEIAKTINLYSEEDQQNNPNLNLTGQQFNQLTDEQAKAIIPSLKVLSRATPFDKLRLVQLLQEMGEVVAVTGDGTNDAAALKQAQVGLAMGSGTAIAQEASDIILLDDSFNSIVTAVMWGRSLYENIQRFLVFQLTINIVALGIALFGPFIGVSLPLTVTQMLWINLIMDTFAALALATEPPHESVMKRQPRNPQDFIISSSMIRLIVSTGLGFLIFLVGFLLYLEKDGIVTNYELSIFFAVFVLLQFWNLFNTRCFGLNQRATLGLTKNPAFMAIAVLIFFGQIAIIQWGGQVFRTVPLSWQEWSLMIIGTSLVLWIGEMRRFLQRIKESG